MIDSFVYIFADLIFLKVQCLQTKIQQDLCKQDFCKPDFSNKNSLGNRIKWGVQS